MVWVHTYFVILHFHVTIFNIIFSVREKQTGIEKVQYYVLSKWRSMLGAEKIHVLNSINAWSHNGFWPVVINLIISLYNYYNNNNNNENGSPLVRNWRPFPTQMDKKKGTACTFFPEKKRSKSCLNLAQKEGFSLEFVKASIAQWGRYNYYP